MTLWEQILIFAWFLSSVFAYLAIRERHELLRLDVEELQRLHVRHLNRHAATLDYATAAAAHQLAEDMCTRSMADHFLYADAVFWAERFEELCVQMKHGKDESHDIQESDQGAGQS